jgi:hypothetical protein
MAGWIGVEMSREKDLSPAKLFWYRATFMIVTGIAIGLNVWQTARNSAQQQQTQRDALKTQGDLSNQLSNANGKLDSISHFEQQFLAFASQQRSATPDAAMGANEAMALAVIKMAQTSSAPLPPDAHIQISYENGNLDKRTITLANSLSVQLSEFHLKNSGGRVTGAVSARLYFSKQIATAGFWQPTPSDEQGFPVAFYISGGLASILINPQETWNLAQFQGTLPQAPADPISAKLKIFYGARNPEEAEFAIQFR